MYEQTIAGRWDPRWEALLDGPRIAVADKLHAFYREYLRAILTPDWLRILVHSGLSDGLIPSRYFELMRHRLFPRPPREEALLMSFHGGLIYHLGIWPLVYQQTFTGAGDPASIDAFIRDRVDGLLLQAPAIVGT